MSETHKSLISRLVSVFGLTISLIWLGLSVICLGNWSGKLFYLIDVFSQPLLALGMAIALVLFLTKNKLSLGICIIACVLLWASLWIPNHNTHPQLDKNEKPIKLIFANMWIRNKSPEKILPWITREDPDIIVTIETSQKTQSALETLRPQYPYHKHLSEAYILSKFPISSHTHTKGISLNIFNLQTPQGEMIVNIAHLTRPWPYTDPNEQRAQLDRLADAVEAQDKGRIILVGDFNATLSAYNLKRFTTKTGLSPLAIDFGTWPVTMPAPLRIGIDNAFSGTDFVISNRKIGPFDGSDHMPVLIHISRSAHNNEAPAPAK